MSQEPRNDESTASPQSAGNIRVVRIAAISFIAIVVIVNIGTFPLFAHGRGGGVVLILANLALMFLGTACARGVERESDGASLTTYAFAVFGVPLVAAGIDIGIIELSGWGGC
jgi:hypothetical protein